MSETTELSHIPVVTAPLLRAMGYLLFVAGLFLVTNIAVVSLMVRLAVPVGVAIPMTIVTLSLTPVMARRAAQAFADAVPHGPTTAVH